MSSVAKQRLLVVIVATALLAGDFTVAHLCAAVFGVGFYWWLIGRLERGVNASAVPTSPGHERR